MFGFFLILHKTHKGGHARNKAFSAPAAQPRTKNFNPPSLGGRQIWVTNEFEVQLPTN